LYLETITLLDLTNVPGYQQLKEWHSSSITEVSTVLPWEWV